MKLNRIRDIEPHPPVVRYEHEAPGDLLHFDIKRLVRIERPSHRVTGDRRDTVRGIGTEFLHIAIDDHSRIAFTAMYPDQTEASATHFLYSAVAWYARLEIPARLITFLVMRRPMGTHLSGHGTLKDAQGALRMRASRRPATCTCRWSKRMSCGRLTLMPRRCWKDGRPQWKAWV
jgi:hypothetical protein